LLEEQVETPDEITPFASELNRAILFPTI